MDRSSNRQVDEASVVLHSPEGDEVKCVIQLDFPMTNNKVVYEALIAGLDLAKAVGAANVVIYCDSQVVTSQINDDYECKGKRMKKYLDKVKIRVKNLQTKFVQIPREENEHVDHLAKAASTEYTLIPNQVLSFVQISLLIDNISMHEIGSKNDWMTPITSYLNDDMLPNGKEAVRKLKVQAMQFILIKDVLYKRGFSRPYLRCLIPEEVNYVMREVHERICGNHFESWSLVHKLIWAGYYRPTM